MNIFYYEASFYLYVLDEHYYKYHFLRDKLCAGDDFEFLFGEPEQLYSNINNGYGVFCAYNPYELKVILVDKEKGILWKMDKE